MYERAWVPPARPETSFFVWGPRQVGKTTLLRQRYPQAMWLDLLRSELYRRYVQNPERLREEYLAQGVDGRPPPLVIIDEFQRVPELLNEVHYLMERHGAVFLLCGSSARKLRRGRANLLGGRALRHELFGITAYEMGEAFALGTLLNRGYLPNVVGKSNYRAYLRAYIADYLQEEIAAEALVRNLPGFTNFLHAAALSDTAIVSLSNVARECGVSQYTVKGYFDILVDTLQGMWLPAYRQRAKRRMVTSSKFYFSDVGVVGELCQRGVLQQGSELWGKAYENWLLHEVKCYNTYRERGAQLFFWRLTTQVEVDLIINHMQVALAIKSTARLTQRDFKGLRQLKLEHPQVGQRLVVCNEPVSRLTEDGILVLPTADFVRRLWAGAFF